MKPDPDKQIVFIDGAVEDRTRLVAGIDPDVEIVVLRADSDGLEQIADAIAGRAGLDTVHLLSHGGPGALILGGTRIDLSNLPRYDQALRTIAAVMQDDGQWLIYGCEVASGEAGRRFVDALSEQTGVRVAAASHKIGWHESGGNWDLDYAPRGAEHALDIPQWHGLLMAAPTLALPVNMTFARTDYSTGNQPTYVTTADVNGDGKADLITSSANVGGVSVLLGNGNGTFGAKSNYAAGILPYSVAVADVSGDGQADVLIANNDGSNTVSVLLGSGPGTFAAKVNYATGTGPTSIVSADLNGDGNIDVVTTNFNSNTVSVLLGTGAGLFTGKADYPTGAAPYGLLSADVNGDGIIDLISTNQNGNTVSVLIGSGTGTFAAKVDYGTGSAPLSVASADVNGDGLVDLVVGTNSGNAISVLLGTGGGTFGTYVNYGLGQAVSVSIGDANGDGKVDVIASDSAGNSISVMLGTGTGFFGPRVSYATGSGPLTITSGDFNGDGKFDLVAANLFSNSVSVFLNTTSVAATAFTEQTSVAASGTIAINDPDGDADWNGGTLTVQVTANPQSTDSLSVRTTNPGGSGIWINTTGNKLMAGAVQIGTTSAALVSNGAALTFNFTANATNALVQDTARAVMFNDSSDTPSITTRSVTFTATDNTSTSVNGVQTITVTAVNDAPTISGVPVAAQSVSVGNAAALADFTVADVDTTTLTVTLTSTNGTINGLTDANGAIPGIQLTGTAASINAAIAAATFTASGVGAANIGISVNDSIAAPVTANYALTGTNAAPVLTLPGTLAFTKADYGTATTPSFVATADVNGDGNVDLITANRVSNTVSVLIGTGAGTFAVKTDYATGSVPTFVLAADVSGDGNADLVVANLFAGTVSVLLGNGTGTFGAKGDYVVGSFPSSATIADVNGDGKIDLIVSNFASNTISVLPGTGGGVFGAKVDYGTGSSPKIVTNADLNGDGKVDLIVANSGTGSNTVSVLLNDGTGAFNAKVDYGTGSRPIPVIAVDVNGDGKVDLIAGNYDGNSVSVLLGTGTGTFGAKVDFATGVGPMSLASADVNGDGKVDLITGNQTSNTISVLLGTGTGTFGAKVDFATGLTPDSVASADVNGDGKADLIAANAFGNTVSVLLNTPAVTPSSFTEQTPLAVNAAIAITDPNGDADWIGGSLKVQITANNESADSLGLVTANPGGSGIWVDTVGNKLMAGAVQIGTASAATAANGTALTFNFTANATNAFVQATARAVQFNNSSDTPGILTRDVTFTATDKNLAFVSGVQTITVTAVNDAPVIGGVPVTAQAVSIGNAAALADFTVTDPDSPTQPLSVTLTSTNGTINGVADADPVLAGIQLIGTAASINSVIAAATFTAIAPAASSIGISATDGLGAPVTATYNLFAGSNAAPTISGVSLTPQTITAGVSATLLPVSVADADSATLAVTLVAANGVITGLVDADPILDGIQLNGTAAAINLALAAVNFTAFLPGDASIGISVSDGIAAPVTATYVLVANTPTIGPNPGIPVPPPDPNPVRNSNGLTPVQEGAAPPLIVPFGPLPLTGDGNGDGALDSLQAAVASAPFINSPTGQSNPGTSPISYVTLVAGSVNGKTDAGTTSSLTNVKQLDAPIKLPAGMTEPLGQISFGAIVPTVGGTEKFSVYVDPSLGINGFFKQNLAGVWVNLASAPYGGAVVVEGNKLRLDFTLTDGGEFDGDGKADGTITVTGAPASMELSLIGYGPKLDGGLHVWS